MILKGQLHIYVRKIQDDSTKVEIFALEDSLKLNAIAELAGGEITEESLKFAQRLIN